MLMKPLLGEVATVDYDGGPRKEEAEQGDESLGKLSLEEDEEDGWQEEGSDRCLTDTSEEALGTGCLTVSQRDGPHLC